MDTLDLRDILLRVSAVIKIRWHMVRNPKTTLKDASKLANSSTIGIRNNDNPPIKEIIHLHLIIIPRAQFLNTAIAPVDI